LLSLTSFRPKRNWQTLTSAQGHDRLGRGVVKEASKSYYSASRMKNCLVLLHGYPFERTLWHGVEERLGPHIFPVTLDLPGFGDEPASSGEPSLEVMAQHVIQFLQKSHIRRAVVGGFSMGGYVALALAELRPDLLAGLALINTQAAADSEETRQARRALIAKLRREGPEAAAEAAIPRMFAGPRAERFVLGWRGRSRGSDGRDRGTLLGPGGDGWPP